MPMQASASSVNSPDYPPSWFDRFSGWVEGLPVPAWAAYLLLGATCAAALIAFQAGQGAYPSGGFDPWHIFLGAQPVLFLALMHYLNRAAERALARFRPVLEQDEAGYERVRYRLTTMPAGSARVATLAGVAAFFLFLGPSVFQIRLAPFQLSIAGGSLQAFGLSPTPASGWAALVIFLLTWMVIGVLVLHTAQQLSEIRRLYAGVDSIDPFQPEPLYAFSSVTSLTAVLLLLIIYGWMWALVRVAREAPGALPLAGPIGVNIFFAALSVFLFVWPLWGAHRLLDTAKKQALGNNAGYFRILVGRLHDAIEQSELAGVDDWQRVLGALELERARLERLATWPWRPEASRGLLAALVVPLVIWAIQFALERLLA
jgi:hypothetical protein